MTDRFESARVEKIKDGFLGADGKVVRGRDAELMQSWQRSQDALGEPANITDVPQVSEEMLDEQLLNTFRAPLTTFSDSLFGTGLGVLLADSRGQILHRWCEDRSAAVHLDRIGVIRGAVLAEDAVGTNGVGTVAAVGKSVQIRGTEHFAEFYRNSVCTGGPVRHPMTGKLLAVVTLSCAMTPRADLLKPLLSSVTQTLEQHALDVEQPAARRVFNTFLEVSRAQPDPVVAFGPQGLLIQNPQAGRFSGDDLERIRQASSEDASGGRHTVDLSTRRVGVQITTVEPGNKIVVVLEQDQRSTRLGSVHPGPDKPSRRLVGRSAEWLSVAANVAKHSGSTAPLIIAGEFGVGKLSLALGHPSHSEPLATSSRAVLDAAERHVVGGQTWLRQLADSVSSRESVVVRGVETLDPPALDGMRTVLENTVHRGAVLLTLATECRDDAEAFGLKYDATTVWVPALRERLADIPALWRHFAMTLAAGASLAPSPGTFELLREYRWPGNLKELRTVVGQLVVAGKTGPVAPDWLPAVMQGATPLTMIERVELEAIRKALREADGNRTRAAEILGLSRATVYRKIKAYHIGT